MLHPATLVRPVKLHRARHEQLWDSTVEGLQALLARVAASLQEHRRRRTERAEWQAAVELDPRVLQDIGAPPWLQSQADSVREQRRFERDLANHGLRRELRHFR